MIINKYLRHICTFPKKSLPVCVFMCSSKYCFMLKSLPHHWHMNCLCPMWMLMWERSWYLYWNLSSQFCIGHSGDVWMPSTEALPEPTLTLSDSRSISHTQNRTCSSQLLGFAVFLKLSYELKGIFFHIVITGTYSTSLNHWERKNKSLHVIPKLT